MMKILKDRVAIAFAAAGILLMALTIACRINPVEGSVVPRFLFENPVGVVIFWILFITCMPVWVATLMLGTAILGSDRNPDWFPRWLHLFELGMLVFQGLVYFLIGKAVSICIRKFSRKKIAPTQNV